MKKTCILLSALCVLNVTGCQKKLNSENSADNRLAKNSKERCYDGVVYLEVWHPTRFGITAKINKDTLKPELCDGI